MHQRWCETRVTSVLRIPWRIDPHRFSDVRRVWEVNRCIEPGTISLYRYWICRYLDYCRAQGLDEHQELTRVGTRRFAVWWRSHGSPRRGRLSSALKSTRSAMRAWSFALGILGVKVPPWESPAVAPPLSATLRAFARFLNEVRGNPPQTVHKKLTHMAMFVAHCRRRHRAVHRARLKDIDDFVVACRQRYARTTVADICSTVRVFQRFLCTTGRSRRDLSGSVLSPIVRVNERPHRALPWKDVQRILHAIDRTRPTGRRDYAILLMMSVYGLGSGEAIGLTLDDINWRAQTLRVVRPKTRVEFLLPLLPAVSRALVSYLRDGRPPLSSTRHLFVTMCTPFKPLACAVSVRHILHTAAARAGVTAPFMGTHVLRHTHACRQLELGAAPKIIGDILGHSDPDSTSAYLRVATDRLRAMALPVPT
jgi:integrase/recombinase XerD